jgi:hypothetical protein
MGILLSPLAGILSMWIYKSIDNRLLEFKLAQGKSTSE